jgi:hypothetical protein
VLYRYGNAEFQSSIRRFVPEGHPFKAFSFSAIRSNASQLVELCFLSPFGRDIWRHPAAATSLALGSGSWSRCALPPVAASPAVRVTLAQSYAEDCLCIWLMVTVI